MSSPQGGIFASVELAIIMMIPEFNYHPYWIIFMNIVSNKSLSIP